MYKKDYPVGEEIFTTINGTGVVAMIRSKSDQESNGTTYYVRVIKSFRRGLDTWDLEESDWAIQEEKVESLVTSIFSVGDQVQSTVSIKGAKFIITGFEHETNKAICIPEGKQGSRSRCRYAYGVDELKPLATTFRITIGDSYVLNDSMAALATRYPGHTSLIQFIVTSNVGRAKVFLVKAVDGQVAIEGLRNAGIYTIRKN